MEKAVVSEHTPEELERDRQAMLGEVDIPLSNFTPGTHGHHEALHAASIALNLVDREVASHPAVLLDPQAFALGQRAVSAMANLYQRLGELAISVEESIMTSHEPLHSDTASGTSGGVARPPARNVDGLRAGGALDAKSGVGQVRDDAPELSWAKVPVPVSTDSTDAGNDPEGGAAPGVARGVLARSGHGVPMNCPGCGAPGRHDVMHNGTAEFEDAIVFNTHTNNWECHECCLK